MHNTYDCLIIGHNETNFDEYVDIIKSQGEKHPSYKDVALSFIKNDDRIYTAMDVINEIRKNEGKEGDFNNYNFLWPVVSYLGNYLTKHGHSFDYINLFQEQKTQLAEKLKNNRYRLIVVTTTLYVSPLPIMEVINFVKAISNDPIVVGGPFLQNKLELYTSEDLQALLLNIGADYYIYSCEGEQALINLLNAKDIDRVPNVFYKKDDRIIINEIEKEYNDIEHLELDYELFTKKRSFNAYNLRTSKSCPFRCSYCSFPSRAGKYAYMTPDKVIEEIKKLGQDQFVTFIDDTFNVPNKRFKEILTKMIDNSITINWNSYIRSDFIDEELIILMKKSGCQGVFIGVESGSDHMLENMNKTARIKNHKKAIELFRKHNIITYASFIIGFTGETAETIQETINFIKEVRPDFFRAQLWFADKSTPIFKRRDEFGITGEGFLWEHNTMTASEATKHIDDIFLSIDESIWMPQNGFEFWSVMFLLNKGYHITGIKNYLRYFNNLIRKKLIKGVDNVLTTDHIDAMAHLLNETKDTNEITQLFDTFKFYTKKEPQKKSKALSGAGAVRKKFNFGV